jgi:hypothetical protein
MVVLVTWWGVCRCMSVRRGSEWEWKWIYGVGLCYLVEGPARRFEACCQLTLADVVGVADDLEKCGVH